MKDDAEGGKRRWKGGAERVGCLSRDDGDRQEERKEQSKEKRERKKLKGNVIFVHIGCILSSTFVSLCDVDETVEDQKSRKSNRHLTLDSLPKKQGMQTKQGN